jgi:hypothetical protein
MLPEAQPTSSTDCATRATAQLHNKALGYAVQVVGRGTIISGRVNNGDGGHFKAYRWNSVVTMKRLPDALL